MRPPQYHRHLRLNYGGACTHRLERGNEAWRKEGIGRELTNFELRKRFCCLGTGHGGEWRWKTKRKRKVTIMGIATQRSAHKVANGTFLGGSSHALDCVVPCQRARCGYSRRQ